MNIELLPGRIERLESVFANIIYNKPEDRVINPTVFNLGEIRDILNEIFDENKCLDVQYTLNTDKQFFGVKVSPLVSASDAVIILATDERIRLEKYQIEFDSKLFELGMDKSELAAITLFEVSSMMDNPQIFDDLRSYVDYSIINNDDIVSIRDSVNASQLVIFAIKDTMTKLSSVLYKTDEDLVYNPIIQAADMVDTLVSAKAIIDSSITGVGETLRTAKPVILQWMFVMYRDIVINSGVIRDTLTDAKAFTASKLEINEIEKTLSALSRIDNTVLTESKDIVKFLESKNMGAVLEVSIFKSLKKSGLRGVENDLYEFRLRVKNCVDPDEANLIMRSINSRIAILEDYMDNENLSEHDARHWYSVIEDYRDLRSELSRKKLNTKQWGVFINYDALDRQFPDYRTSAE